MSESTIIRATEPMDAQGIAELLAELNYATSPDAVISRLNDLQQSGAAAFVATSGDHVLGLLTVCRMSVLHRARDDARISTLVVAKSARNTGVGRALVDRANEWAKTKGCGRIEVTSGNARTDAHAFYLHLGFEQTSQRFSKTFHLDEL